jgi:hypothetical protein
MTVHRANRPPSQALFHRMRQFLRHIMLFLTRCAVILCHVPSYDASPQEFLLLFTNYLLHCHDLSCMLVYKEGLLKTYSHVLVLHLITSSAFLSHNTQRC